MPTQTQQPGWGTYAAASIDNAASVIASGNANRRTQKWNEKMLSQQRAWALEDWATQNEYNSPRAQMQRFQEAGLNPNLIYGQTNTAAPVRSTDSKSMVYQRPEFEKASSVLAQSTNLAMSKAQMDNLRAQNTVLLQEAALKAATTAGAGITNARNAFELEQAQTLKETSLTMAQMQLEKLGADIGLTNTNAAAAHNKMEQDMDDFLGMSIRSRLQNQLSEKQLAQYDSVLKSQNYKQEVEALDAKLASKGIRPTDPLYYRAALQVVDAIMKKLGIHNPIKD